MANITPQILTGARLTGKPLQLTTFKWVLMGTGMSMHENSVTSLFVTTESSLE